MRAGDMPWYRLLLLPSPKNAIGSESANNREFDKYLRLTKIRADRFGSFGLLSSVVQMVMESVIFERLA